jgi:DnaK suppressor protein
MTAKKTPPKTSKTAKPAAPATSASAKSASAKSAVGKPDAAAGPVNEPAKAKPAAKPGAKPAAKATDKSPPSNGSERKEVVATYVQRNPRPIAPPADVEDGEDGNLLSGPRNVQPYISKRGEQYMSREQLEHFRTILQSWKTDLMREVDRTVSHMKDEAANFPDPNDRATQEEEFSLELRTRDRERKLIRKIEEALERIEDGSYGYCLETGEEIGIKRLEARPVATLSLEAQERRERREKQYGDRDDRYR